MGVTQSKNKWRQADAWSLCSWGGYLKRDYSNPHSKVIRYGPRTSTSLLGHIAMFAAVTGAAAGPPQTQRNQYFYFVLPDDYAYADAMSYWAYKPGSSSDISLQGYEFFKMKAKGVNICHRVYLLRRVGMEVPQQQVEVFNRICQEVGASANWDVFSYVAHQGHQAG